MKRSLNIIKLELDFLDNLLKTNFTIREEIGKSIDETLDRLAIKQAINHQEIIQIILVNFKYSVIEACRDRSLSFEFSKLTLKDICYFYMIYRLNDNDN